MWHTARGRSGAAKWTEASAYSLLTHPCTPYCLAGHPTERTSSFLNSRCPRISLPGSTKYPQLGALLESCSRTITSSNSTPTGLRTERKLSSPENRMTHLLQSGSLMSKLISFQRCQHQKGFIRRDGLPTAATCRPSPRIPKI